MQCATALQLRLSGIFQPFSVLFAAAMLAGVYTTAAFASITNVQLAPSATSPQPVGSTITWTASAQDSNPGPLTYKFEVGMSGSAAFSMLRDFSLANTLTWVPSAVEGIYQIRVTARDFLSGESAQRTVSFQITSLVTGGTPVVTATAHPLVALFSAPPCPPGSSMRVAFQRDGTTTFSYTNFRPCGAGSMNFYVAGMGVSQLYHMHYEVLTGSTLTINPTVLNFTTGAVPSSLVLPPTTTPVPAAASADLTTGILLMDYLTVPNLPPGVPLATNLKGNVMWYYPAMNDPSQTYSLLTRPVPGGTMLVIAAGQGTGTGISQGVTSQEILREIDLDGNALRETNADRVSEQLVARGTDPISCFHHEAIRLANGNTVVLGSNQRIFPAGTQGSPGAVNVLGLMVIVLDSNWQVIWSWNAFDHAGGGTQLDINRPAVLGETCSTSMFGCPLLISSPANDWLHGNSVQYVPSDGSFLVSLRNQDWVVKIDYGNGSGSGNILWRLGAGGDFALSSGGPTTWFSHQHEAAFETTGVMSLFDNGTTRVMQAGAGNSRGQTWGLDETNKIANIGWNVDLGAFSPAGGSAQLLVNGDYMFENGSINFQSGPVAYTYQQALEVNSAASVVFELQGQRGSYRCWRMRDMYTPPGS